MGLRNRNLYLDKNCFFVTTTCNKWKPLIQLTGTYQLIEDSFTFVNKKYLAVTLAYVIMPNHLHMIVYFNKSNKLSDYMRDFKKFTSVKIRQALESNGYADVLNSIRHQDPKRSFQVWQDRFDDLFLESKHILEQKLEYIHNNPLQEHWSLVKRPEDYTYSSAMFYETGVQPNLLVEDYRELF